VVALGTGAVTMPDETPREVLNAFFAALRDWEREALRQNEEAERAGRALDVASLRQQREAILARYCTRRRRVYSSIVSYGKFLSYDPDAEEVLEVKEEPGRRVVIVTRQQTGFRSRRRFVLVKQAGRWRVDSKQVFEDRRWRRGHL
jgi:uncharacterized protein